MAFIMDGLHAEAYDRTYTDHQLIKRILHYFKAQSPVIVGITLLIVFASVLDALSPLLMSRGIDLLMKNTGALPIILLLISLILFTTSFSWICHFFREVLTARAVGNVILQLRTDAFSAVVARDLAFFDEFPSGKLVSRVTSDTESFTSVITLSLELLSQVLLFLIVASVLFFENWQLALLTLVVMPVIFATSLGFRRLARRLTRKSQRSVARVNSNIQEILQGITITKNFRQERRMYNEFQKINIQSYIVNLRSDFLYKSILPILTLIANMGLVVVLYFGGLSVFRHSISAGDWFLFLQCLGLLWIPLTSIASFGSQFQLGLSASERVFSLLDARPQVCQIAQQPVSALKGKVEFKDVLFRYNQRQTVLSDFSLTIHSGETVALVGHTGAGKSSLGKLIARFYEFQSGQILIDDRNIRSFDLHDYHCHLGIIPQTPYLFSGTIADNIRYALPEASDREVEQAVRNIGGGDWLKTLPQKLETLVSEEGKSLSMGQRQLIAFARVVLQDPEIIIMDEATASIDPLTEAQIQEGLDAIFHGRTAIVIAHRLSTVRAADRILVLDQGRVIEDGNHDALLQRGGHYADLYNTYFRHQSLNYTPGEGFVPVNAGG
jgi:ABC-type multidrug transport system fused ATPase/permease subunit